MKIIIIGPVYPYKGGIAHYTGLMAKSLSKENDVRIISFSLQYPKFLYNREQKDFGNDSFRFDDVYFRLNTINPISYVKTACFINRANADLVIFQWWHPFFSPSYWTILRLLNRKIKTLFLCHNVLPHEVFPFQKLITKSVLKKANAHIVHSVQDEKKLTGLIHNTICRRTVHPTYDAFNKKNISQKEARHILHIPEEEKIILFFGFVRKYKGLRHLIHALPEIVAKVPFCKLLIAGEFFENDKSEYLDLIKDMGCENDVRIYSDYIPDNEVENYFAACDVVVLPYESATQSGIVQIAYGFEKPVIATDVGGLPEVILNGETGYIVPAFDALKLAAAIIRFFKERKDKIFMQNIRLQQDRFSWDRMNTVVNDLFHAL